MSLRRRRRAKRERHPPNGEEQNLTSDTSCRRDTPMSGHGGWRPTCRRSQRRRCRLLYSRVRRSPVRPGDGRGDPIAAARRLSRRAKTRRVQRSKTCLFGHRVGVSSSRHSRIPLTLQRLGGSIPSRTSGSNGSTRALFLYPRGGHRSRWRLTQ